MHINKEINSILSDDDKHWEENKQADVIQWVNLNVVAYSIRKTSLKKYYVN